MKKSNARTRNRTAAKTAPPKPRGLTAEDLDRCKRVEVSNVIRKLRMGRTLTTAERDLLDQARARPPSTEGNRTFDSLAQAAKSLGLTVEILRTAKAAGCPAFRNTRIYEAELLVWLDRTNADATSATEPLELNIREARRRLVLEQARSLKIRNDRTEAALVPRAEIDATLARATARYAALRIRRENEDPPRLAAAAGDIPACRRLIADWFDDIARACDGLWA